MSVNFQSGWKAVKCKGTQKVGGDASNPAVLAPAQRAVLFAIAEKNRNRTLLLASDPCSLAIMSSKNIKHWALCLPTYLNFIGAQIPAMPIARTNICGRACVATAAAG